MPRKRKFEEQALIELLVIEDFTNPEKGGRIIYASEGIFEKWQKKLPQGTPTALAYSLTEIRVRAFGGARVSFRNVVVSKSRNYELPSDNHFYNQFDIPYNNKVRDIFTMISSSSPKIKGR